MSAVRKRDVAGALGALVVLAACGSAAPPPLTAISTLLSDALDQLNSASSVHLVMDYTIGNGKFHTDIHVELPSNLTGAVTQNAVTVQVVQSGGKLFVQGQDYISEYGSSYEGKLVGNRWMLDEPGNLRATPLDVDTLMGMGRALLKREFHGKRIDHVVAGAEFTAELTGDFGAMYVMEEPPHRLVKFETASGYVPAEGYSDVTAELLEYGDTVSIALPADFADLNDPTTLPPEYDVKGQWNFDRCDSSGCGFNATVENLGGTFATPAPSTFTLTLTHANHTLIDKCSGNIPVVAHDGTTTIGCRVTSRAWLNFAYAGGEYYGQITIDNPPYDG